MFDKAEIRVRAGDGGDGTISFRREKFVPLGGPDGGNGGAGGDVIVRASDSVDSLRGYRRNRVYRAGNGDAGGSARKHGRRGDELVLNVPPGTIVSYRDPDGEVYPAGDLAGAGSQLVVARGGKGGWGNTRYVSSTRQAPQIAQRGETGDERTLLLEMRLIADVGIIGYPNAGKSTLLAAASAAHPKIDSYPFTTIEPVLGVVEVGLETFIMAEIPGLIEGAHLGRGLGHDFLRHAMRTKVLIHLISGEADSPIDDMLHLNRELTLYDPSLGMRPQLIALNKADLPQVRARLGELAEEMHGAGIEVYCISAASGEGVPALMTAAARLLKETSAPAAEPAGKPGKVFRPAPGDRGVRVGKEGDVFVVTAPSLERIFPGDGVSHGELRWQLESQFKRLGISKALEKAGVKPGDKIRCGRLEWEW